MPSSYVFELIPPVPRIIELVVIAGGLVVSDTCVRLGALTTSSFAGIDAVPVATVAALEMVVDGDGPELESAALDVCVGNSGGLDGVW
jgi:hypothetical protein